MDSHRLPDDQPIFDQLPDLLMGVDSSNYVGLIEIQPDLLFATMEDTRGKPLPKLSMAAAMVVERPNSNLIHFKFIFIF